MSRDLYVCVWMCQQILMCTCWCVKRFLYLCTCWCVKRFLYLCVDVSTDLSVYMLMCQEIFMSVYGCVNRSLWPVWYVNRSRHCGCVQTLCPSPAVAPHWCHHTASHLPVLASAPCLPCQTACSPQSKSLLLPVLCWPALDIMEPHPCQTAQSP